MKEKNKENIEKSSKLKTILKILLTIVMAIILIILYARFIGTKGLKVKEYKIVNENFKDNFYGLKIVQLSDIHYGMTTNNRDLEKIVDEINLLKPDIVFFTGDLYSTDITSEQKDELTKNLLDINAKLGKYAISGNHDNEEFDTIIKNANFINLNNNYDLIYNNYSSNFSSIFIAGINTNDIDFTKINEYLNQNNENNIVYKILIMHEPDKVLEFDYSPYNIIFAGHSHNGQVRIPFIGAIHTPEGSKKYYDEYYKLNNTDMYISSGIGTTDIKLRLFNRPSINFYRLTNK